MKEDKISFSKQVATADPLSKAYIYYVSPRSNSIFTITNSQNQT